MTVLFPGEVVWDVGTWVVRRFIDDAARHLDEAPTLAPDIEDSITSGIPVLDLRQPTAAMLAEAERLVDLVMAANLVTRGTDFHDPSAFPLYLEKLRDLRELIRAVRPRGADAAPLEGTWLFEYGSENAPDSPTGLERLVLEPDGRFQFDNRHLGQLVARRTGRIEPAALLEIAGSLAAAGFPAVPEHDMLPGADYLTIASGGRFACMQVASARAFPGYADLIRRLLPWMHYLVDLQGEPPTELRVDPPRGA